LAAKNIQPMDLKGNMNYYSAGDDSGSSVQLEALESIPLRIVTNSEEQFMPTTTDYGLAHPTFPRAWVNVKPFLAKPAVQYRGDYVVFKTKFFVDNRCERKCSKGICLGPCDFATPVVANMALKGWNEKRKRYDYLTSWTDGGVVQPQFQGLITGLGFNIPKHYINETDTFRLVVEFDDPKFDFEKFKNNIKRRYGRMEQHLPRLGRSEIASIPNINQIRENALLPSITTINGLNFDQKLDGASAAVDTLRQFLNYKVWPPYYDSLCNKDLSTCTDIKKRYVSTIVDFKFKRSGMNYDIEVISLKHNNKIDNKQNNNNNKLPALNCGF
jgi:hypothetical protein